MSRLAIVEGEGELDRRVPRQLAVGMAVAAIARQQRAVRVDPTQAGFADAAVDFRQGVDRENRSPGSVPSLKMR